MNRGMKLYRMQVTYAITITATISKNSMKQWIIFRFFLFLFRQSVDFSEKSMDQWTENLSPNTYKETMFDRKFHLYPFYWFILTHFLCLTRRLWFLFKHFSKYHEFATFELRRQQPAYHMPWLQSWGLFISFRSSFAESRKCMKRKSFGEWTCYWISHNVVFNSEFHISNCVEIILQLISKKLASFKNFILLHFVTIKTTVQKNGNISMDNNEQ